MDSKYERAAGYQCQSRFIEREKMAVRVGFTAITAITYCFCCFSVRYIDVSDTGNGTGSCFIIHGHAGSTVADTYGRGVALGRMKEALDKGFEGLRGDPASHPIWTET